MQTPNNKDPTCLYCNKEATAIVVIRTKELYACDNCAGVVSEFLSKSKAVDHIVYDIEECK